MQTFEKRVDLYLFARNCMDDPRFRNLIILAGKSGVPAIVSRMGDSKEIWDKAELMTILVAIDTNCRCISGNPDIMYQLEKIADEVQTNPKNTSRKTYQSTFQESLETLRNRSRVGIAG